ncbi:uncharacterized protein LTR77_010059 [Saxophila tyrrhenica]|uniref:L-ornithine N(5)-monooxygenase [NAD(P)H] n=1 Tax=Saxophila tyrrhenica TaxID=1690608 RepID=A0AAV9P0N0_9PEZI|nr:hypothetical protein LTR77_010059 [Saxophila tyrrhenica]
MSPHSRSLAAQRRGMSDRGTQYEAVVVGAGPAGITCVGNLLERKLSPILWVDDAFDGGRVNRLYREVPSNTKVKTFLDFAEALTPFREIVSAGGKQEGRMRELKGVDPEKGCKLGMAADMCLALTEGLRGLPGVVATKGRLEEGTLDENPRSPSQWVVKVREGGDAVTSVRTKRLVLCTGASPTIEPLPVELQNSRPLELDTALSPTRLSSALSSQSPLNVAVIGASHSAILVLMNLYHLASSSKPDLRIRWLTRHSLRYAEYMDGWILRDNTGLKGEAAEWARQNLEPETFKQSDVSNFIKRIDYEAGDEEGTYEENLQGCQFYVQAIGYRPDPLPKLKTRGGKEITPYFDNERGTFTYVKESEGGSVGDLARLPGLYGGGIAFPERVVDPRGNVEHAVGFWKFMKFVQRVSPGWN